MNDQDFQQKVMDSLARLETHMGVILGAPGQEGRLPKLEADVEVLARRTGELEQSKSKVLLAGSGLMVAFQLFISWLFRGK